MNRILHKILVTHTRRHVVCFFPLHAPVIIFTMPALFWFVKMDSVITNWPDDLFIFHIILLILQGLIPALFTVIKVLCFLYKDFKTFFLLLLSLMHRAQMFSQINGLSDFNFSAVSFCLIFLMICV